MDAEQVTVTASLQACEAPARQDADPAAASRARLGDRSTYIGSSDVPMIVGCSPHGGPMDVWIAKCMPDAEAKEPEAECLRLGRRLQRPIAEEVAERLGLELLAEEVEVEHPAYPHLRAHLDFLARDRARRLGLLEVKATNTWAPAWRDLDEGEIPQSVLAQVTYQAKLQRAAAALQAQPVERIIVARLVGLSVRVYEVEYDAELGALLVERADAFWREHIVPRVRPPADGSEAWREYLRRRFPRSSGKARPPTEVERALVHTYRDACTAAKRAERTKEQIAQQLKEAIGEARELEGLARWAEEGSVVSWKAIAEELGAAPALVKKHTTPKGRTLRLLGSKED